MKKSFFDYFPPPVFLQMPAVGFDISDRSIKYVELEKEKGGIFVKKFGERIIPEGLIELGEIKKKDELTDFLKSIKEEIKTEYVIVGLPEEKSFLSHISLPTMDIKDVRGAIELQIEEHIPMSASEVVFDFEIIGRNNLKNNLDINLVAFPMSLVHDYEEVLVNSGFTPLVFETETSATARVIVPKDNYDETTMIIDFGKTRITFCVVHEGKVQFTSSVKVGGVELEMALEKSLGVDNQGAEKIKKEQGFVKNKENEKVFEAMLPVMSAIKDEAIKYVNYWNSHIKDSFHLNQGRVAKVFLCGGDSNLIGFPEYLSYDLKLPVNLGNPWANIMSFEDHIPKIELRESLAYSNAIGLALRSIIR